MKLIYKLLIGMVIILAMTACSAKDSETINLNRDYVLHHDNTDNQRNILLKEDLEYFKKKLPKLHKNLFSIITKEEFETRTTELINNIDKQNNKQVFTELNKIVASIGDAHTAMNLMEGYGFPLELWIFDGKVYVVNTDLKLKEMMNGQIVKINGVDMEQVIDQLSSLIPHENDSWLMAMIPSYLLIPNYMYNLGIIAYEHEAVFTIDKAGELMDFTVTAINNDETIEYVDNTTANAMVGKFDKYYDYKYYPDQKAVCLSYNVCMDMEELTFKAFNDEMFEVIEDNKVEKIIIDLRSNTGGNSTIIKPFINRLKSYTAATKNVKVYTLIGRNTFSSGMFAIYEVKDNIPNAISVGEPTGGALDRYGDIKILTLPNSRIPISYSTKYFKFSDMFQYKNEGVDTFIPDIPMQPTIEDYKNGTDTVLAYALEN